MLKNKLLNNNNNHSQIVSSSGFLLDGNHYIQKIFCLNYLCHALFYMCQYTDIKEKSNKTELGAYIDTTIGFLSKAKIIPVTCVPVRRILSEVEHSSGVLGITITNTEIKILKQAIYERLDVTVRFHQRCYTHKNWCMRMYFMLPII